METATGPREGEATLPAPVHARCFACGPDNPAGLRLAFEADGPRGVVARRTLGDAWQGYDGVVQGGIVCLLLDSAMTNCLFRRGVHGVTALMSVRFRHPVRTNVPLLVRATPTGEDGPSRARRRIFSLTATIEQEGEERASATATFVRTGPVARPDATV